MKTPSLIPARVSAQAVPLKTTSSQITREHLLFREEIHDDLHEPQHYYPSMSVHPSSQVHFESMIEGVSSDQEGRNAASIQWFTGERGALPAELLALA